MRLGELCGLANPLESSVLLGFTRDFYASTEDILAPFAAKADAD
jgi:hypothetical protein